MREPVINGDPVSEQGAAVELRLHPRDPEFIPQWMATKAAAFHKKEEARARRRQRDRARRQRKKAEATQAAEQATDASSDQDSQKRTRPKHWAPAVHLESLSWRHPDASRLRAPGDGALCRCATTHLATSPAHVTKEFSHAHSHDHVSQPLGQQHVRRQVEPIRD